METLRIKTDFEGKSEYFDIKNFDIEKYNNIDCTEYSLKIDVLIEQGLTKIFGYKVYSLPVCNLTPAEFKNKMAGGIGDCAGVGNLSNDRVIFDASIFE